MIKTTNEEYKIKCAKVHGDRYDYSITNYINSRSKINIICKIHGIFSQLAGSHLNSKQGCPRCGGNICLEEDFITKSKLAHGNNYNYSKINYIDSKTKILLICNNCGLESWQIPSFHLIKTGCIGCNPFSNGFKLSLTDYFNKCSVEHNNFYSYPKLDYKNINSKITIICPVHGEFSQDAGTHLHGGGCGKCAGNIKQTTEEYIIKANLIHNFKYNYNKTNYLNTNTKITIICNEHGEFLQTPNKHLSGQGCLKCSRYVSDTESFKIKAEEIHKNKYDYSCVNYTKSQIKIIIICEFHGEFLQTPNKHLLGQGCPNCFESKGELKIENYLKINNIEYNKQYRFENCRNVYSLPFDFYLENYNLLIEFDGRQHFENVWDNLEKTQLHDAIKNKYCLDNNIPLLRIPYTEFKNIEEILKERVV